MKNDDIAQDLHWTLNPVIKFILSPLNLAHGSETRGQLDRL